MDRNFAAKDALRDDLDGRTPQECVDRNKNTGKQIAQMFIVALHRSAWIEINRRQL